MGTLDTSIDSLAHISPGVGFDPTSIEKKSGHSSKKNTKRRKSERGNMMQLMIYLVFESPEILRLNRRILFQYCRYIISMAGSLFIFFFFLHEQILET